MRGLKGAGIILAVIVGVVALIFLLALHIAELLWVSNNVLDYLNIAAAIAFAACVFVLLPLSLFRVTRNVSAYGFYISSVVCGVATWVLGFLVTFQHWGVTGLFVGLFLAGVGVVPIGILASAFNASWPQVGDLTLGLVLTFGTRAIVYLLAQRIDRDEAGISSPSEPAPIARSAISYAKEKWGALVSIDHIQNLQIIMAALFVLVVGGQAVYRALHPSRSNYDYLQLMANLSAHPIASVSGALLPALIFSPLVYWMLGWIIRRNACRFKICEHCAETIKSNAKVCRYCGRDVATAERVGVEARPVQAASAADVASATDQAPSSPNRLQLSRPALATASLLGLVLVGSFGVWLADTQKTLVPPSTKVTADQIKEADTLPVIKPVVVAPVVAPPVKPCTPMPSANLTPYELKKWAEKVYNTTSSLPDFCSPVLQPGPVSEADMKAFNILSARCVQYPVGYRNAALAEFCKTLKR